MKRVATVTLATPLFIMGALTNSVLAADVSPLSTPMNMSKTTSARVIAGTVDATGCVLDENGTTLATLTDASLSKADYFAQTLEDRLLDLRQAVADAQSARRLTTAQGCDFRASMDNVTHTAATYTTNKKKLSFAQMLSLSKELDAVNIAFAAASGVPALPPLLMTSGTVTRVAIKIDQTRKPTVFKPAEVATKKAEPTTVTSLISKADPSGVTKNASVYAWPIEINNPTPSERVDVKQAELAAAIERERLAGRLSPAEARRLRSGLELIALKIDRCRISGPLKPKDSKSLMSDLDRLATRIKSTAGKYSPSVSIR
jgi:hypothetical protein